jgi:hypothetical protein
MHKVIRIIVFAKTSEEALTKAKELFEKELVPRPFDYGAFFDDNESTMSGKARWGSLPAVARADSNEGKQLIQDGIDATKRDFQDNITCIREVLSLYSDEEIWHQEILDKNKKMLEVIEEDDKRNKLFNLRMFKHFCFKLGDYYDGWLYGNDGELINDEEHLKNVLDKWKTLYEAKKKDPYKGLDVWVIPVDIHQ